MTRLEDLPNELFCILFQYFNINELYQSFFQLNLRFKNLLNSLSNYYCYFDGKDNVDIINIFASKIKTIYIKDNSTFISLAPFYNSLLILIVERLTDKYLNQLPFLIHLKYLSIKKRPDDRLSSKLTQYVASTIQLHHLSLPYWCFDEGNHVFLSVHSLRLHRYVRSNELTPVRRHVPNLTHLFYDDHYIEEFPVIDNIISNIHQCLSYFRLNLPNGFTYSQLDSYLACVPHIKSFHLLTSPCLVYKNHISPYAILNVIADIIEKRLLNLQKFSCLAIFNIISNEPFDIIKIHSIYNQNYSVKIEKNTEKFRSIWLKN